MNIFLSPSAPENLVSRDGLGSLVPRQPVHLHTQTEIWCLLKGFLPISAAVNLKDSFKRVLPWQVIMCVVIPFILDVRLVDVPAGVD